MHSKKKEHAIDLEPTPPLSQAAKGNQFLAKPVWPVFALADAGSPPVLTRIGGIGDRRERAGRKIFQNTTTTGSGGEHHRNDFGGAGAVRICLALLRGGKKVRFLADVCSAPSPNWAARDFLDAGRYALDLATGKSCAPEIAD